MVVALADLAGLQKVASFTLNNLYRPGDTIHTTYVEDTGNSGQPLTHQAESQHHCLGAGVLSTHAGDAKVCLSYAQSLQTVL